MGQFDPYRNIEVVRELNCLYYVLFVSYSIIVCGVLIWSKKNTPQEEVLKRKELRIALKIFFWAGMILSIMEIIGILSGLRTYVVEGRKNPPIAFLIGVVMGFGEGGAASAVIFLAASAILQKKYLKGACCILSLAALML